MPILRLRFYGRFAFAIEGQKDSEETETGTIFVLAPRFGQTFDPHEALMSIRRDQLSIDPKLTDRKPSHKVVGDAARVIEAELFVWRLDNARVSFKAVGAPKPPSARLEMEDPNRTVFRIAELLVKGGADEGKLDLDVLKPSANGKTQALVEITRGLGHAKLASRFDRATLVTQSDVDNKSNKDAEIGKRDELTGVLHPFELSDLVEFDLPLAINTPTTLLVTDANGTGQVSVKAETADEVVTVSFSNFCATLPELEEYDLEFGRYYDLLATRPPDEKLLIPKHSIDGGELEECGLQAHITYDKASGTVIK